MAERLAYLEAVIGADITQFRKAMRDVRNDVGVLSETVNGLGKLGRTATFAISAPLATLGSYAVQSASEFDGAMRNINSIAGMSEAQLDALSASILDFGATTRGGAIESANSLYTVFSAGITDTALAMDTMKVSTMTAEAGLADMETTTEALVASMLSYGTANMTATRASDALTAMVQVGVGSMQSFANAVANVLPSSSALNISIEDTYGALAFMTQRGLSASKASTSLNSALTALVKPTDAMKASMQSLGVDGAEGLIEKYGTLDEIMKALISTTDGTSAGLAELFANVRGKRFADLVASDLDGFKGAMDEFNEIVDGATARAHAEQMKSFSAQWDLMTSAIEGASIAVGQELLPVLIPFVQAITEGFNGLSQLNPELLKMGIAFAGAVTVGAPLLWLLTTLLNPIGLLLGAVSSLGVTIAQNFSSISDAFDSVADKIPALKSLAATFTNLFGEMPTAEEVISDSALSINVEDLITVEAEENKTVWDYWLERTDQSITWSEFKEMWIANNGTLDIIAGELVTINETEIGDEVAGSLNATDSIFQAEIDRRAKLQIEADKLIAINNPQGIAMGFGQKLEMAFTAIKRKMPFILGSVLEGVHSWFDENVGAGIDWVAGIFAGSENTGGKSPVYTAFTKILSGDFTGALNAIVPELGTKVATFLESIFDTGQDSSFPKIESALGTLITNVGEWFLNEGIPTLSRSIGYFAGKVGTLIFDAFSMIGDFISGGGAGDAIGDAGGVMEDSVVNPMMEGFNDAVAGTEFDSALTSLFTDLQTAWDALDMGMIVTGIDDFATGITSGLTSLVEADWSGVVKIIGFVQKLSNWVSAGVLSGAGEAFDNIGSAIGNFATGVAEVLNGDSNGFVLLAQGILDVGFALISLPVSVFDSIISGINGLFGIDLPQLGTLIDSIQNTLNSAFSDTTVEGINWTALLNPVGADEDARQIGGDLAQVYYDEFETTLNSLSDSPINIFGDGEQATFNFDETTSLATIRSAFATMIDNLANEDLEGTNIATTSASFAESIAIHYADAFEGVDWESYIENPIDFDTMFAEWIAEANANDPKYGWDGSIIYADDTETPTEQAQTIVDNLSTAVDESVPTTLANPTMLDQEALAQQGTDSAVSMTEALSSGLSDAFLNGEMTPESFQESFLTPFNDNWLATFGDESAIRLANVAFSTEFATVMGITAVSASVTSIQVANSMLTLGASVKDASQTIQDEMLKAKGSIESLLLEIRKLASISTSLKVKVEVTGEINAPETDGSHADGLPYVPFDGYIAELHKGERVLTAEENRNHDKMDISNVTDSAGGNTTTNTNNTNYINISGVQDVDALLDEFDRRGIYLNA